MSKVSAYARKRLAEYFLQQYQHYIEIVTKGYRQAGLHEIQMVERQLRDQERKDWRWKWDVRKAVLPLVWMGTHLVFPDGLKRGKPLKLEPWQIFLVMVLFGWVDREQGTRRYIDAYIEIPRKNGKSTLCAAIADYMTFSAEEDRGTPTYIAATSLDQAGECFKRAALCMTEKDSDGIRVANSKNNKVITKGTQQIIAISGTPKDGKLTHCAIIDEYHQHVTNDLVNSIVSGNVSDPESLTFRITTAGSDLTSVCKQERDKCVQIVEGSLSTDRYFVAIFCADKGDDITSPDTWEKANPNWNVSVDADMIQARYDACKGNAAQLNDFRTKNLDIWVNALGRWADMEAWNSLCCEPFGRELLDGYQCFGGLDLSAVSDFTAFVADFPIGDCHYLDCMFFIPEGRTLELEKELKIPLFQWIDDGYVIATPGPVIDYQYICDYLDDYRARYSIRLIAADKWQLSSLARIMPPWFQNCTFEFSQGLKSMSPSVKEFERLYKTGRIKSGGNPVLRWMMSCTEAWLDNTGNVRLVKPRHKGSSARIDGVIASVMATDTAITQTPEALDPTTAVVFF